MKRSVVITISVFLSTALILFGCKKESEEVINPKEVSGTIDTPATWNHTDGLSADYIVSGVLNINADLLVLPGTTIQLKPGASIVVGATGSFNAVGNAGNRITLSGYPASTKSWSSWNSIVFYSMSAKNALHFCNIKLGGAGDFVTPDAMVVVGQNSFAEGKVSIRDCVFEGSAGHGLFINDQSEVTGLLNNTFSNNAKFPITLTNENLNDLNGGNSFKGNGKNYVEIRDCVFPTGEAQAWKDMPVPYYIQQQVRLTGEYTMQAGTEVVFSPEGYLNVWDGNSSGFLKAVGTAADNIIFGLDPVSSAYWRGIGISSSGLSVFKHCRIVNAGGEENQYGQQASVSFEGNPQSSVEIRDCVFDNSQGFGIDLGGISNFNSSFAVDK